MNLSALQSVAQIEDWVIVIESDSFTTVDG